MCAVAPVASQLLPRPPEPRCASAGSRVCCPRGWPGAPSGRAELSVGFLLGRHPACTPSAQPPREGELGLRTAPRPPQARRAGGLRSRVCWSPLVNGHSTFRSRNSLSLPAPCLGLPPGCWRNSFFGHSETPLGRKPNKAGPVLSLTGLAGGAAGRRGAQSCRPGHLRSLRTGSSFVWLAAVYFKKKKKIVLFLAKICNSFFQNIFF